MWRLRRINNLRLMSRMKCYLMWIGFGLSGLVLFAGLLGAAWLSAY